MAGGDTPEDVANQALDAIGWSQVLGSLEDGSHHAKILLRAYRQCRLQMLRACNWNFARKSAPLLLLADASGATALVGTTVPNPNFIYEYAYPGDCLKARFVPWNPMQPLSSAPVDNTALDPSTPLTTGLATLPLMAGRIVPARFLVASDFNYPDGNSQATARTVVLTNVQNATLVYTCDVVVPQLWDALFRSALVAYIASEVALPIWADKDRKFGLEIRAQQIEIVRSKVLEARVIDGNENPTSSDIRVDWMDGRRSGGGYLNGFGGDSGANDIGVLGYGFDSLSLPNGSTF